ncbi:hypothetical protein KIPB_006224 [Kipferlia bialata]|uniref:Uncharacterized protein n=1 Tax=Kipferlia bialata TaxID=797122 RepID=A0A391NM64_9EUKA|nr:hypothetical protein KIPB_003964 [Kipferlia bialata]GCA62857.1 hypothetical protein KIPB_006224 [Kipferlia bialata]|eukprot:g3964.t1
MSGGDPLTHIVQTLEAALADVTAKRDEMLPTVTQHEQMASQYNRLKKRLDSTSAGYYSEVYFDKILTQLRAQKGEDSMHEVFSQVKKSAFRVISLQKDLVDILKRSAAPAKGASPPVSTGTDS